MSISKVFKSLVKRKMALALSAIVLTVSSLVPALFIAESPFLPSNSSVNALIPSKLIKFSSYGELRDFLNNSVRYLSLLGGPERLTVFTAMGTEAKSTSVNVGYSRTNIQVEGVDEADTVKTDGRRIYLALGKKVLIVRAYPPEEVRVSSEIRVNGTVLGLFVSGGKLVIISYNEAYYYAETTLGDSRKEERVLFIEPRTLVLIYNVEETETPALIRNVALSGTYFNSRIIGNHVYILTFSPAYLRDNEPTLPEISDGGHTLKISPTSIYYSNVPDFYNAFTLMAAINIEDPSESVNYETFLFGYASCIYVSLNNIYVATPKYSEIGWITEVHRIRIEGGRIMYEASGAVPGLILNQFSIDEYNGYFRIATMTDQQVFRGLFSQTTLTEDSGPRSNVYVLNMSLSVVGGIEGLAPGERMYSARFMGDRCYLVTFKKVDPLFVISLEDPTNPKILGKLKIPGYSDYLHPYDENHLIGIGKWTVEAEEGDFAWYQGVKISLFDVSDVEHPKEVSSYIIGDRGTDSPVLRDHKALLFDRELKLLAMPVLVAEIDESKYPNGVPPNIYGDYVWQGLYVFNVTESGIRLKGKVTHIDDPEEFLRSGYRFYSDYTIERALYIGDVLYTISNKMIKMNDLINLSEIGSLKLP